MIHFDMRLVKEGVIGTYAFWKLISQHATLMATRSAERNPSERGSMRKYQRCLMDAPTWVSIYRAQQADIFEREADGHQLSRPKTDCEAVAHNLLSSHDCSTV